jgi:hypothetical protein
MKSFTRRSLMLLVLLAATLFTTPSIYASCLHNITGELGDGFCSCGSSAGPYCMLYNGTDITDAMAPFLEVGCDIMCPGVPYISKNGAPPTPIPRMFKYPKSYQLARANPG